VEHEAREKNGQIKTIIKVLIMNDADICKLTIKHTEEITVPIEKLYLDPNNPRFSSKRPNKITPDRYMDPMVISETRDLMLDKPKDGFKIDQMMGDFLTKGFIDGDTIIVQKILNTDDWYTVREGNRRVTAIQSLLVNKEETEKKRKGLCKELSELPVTELIQGDLNDEDCGKLLDFILGVRHLGQLKKWTPFARGTLLYDAYIEIKPQMTKSTDGTFEWKVDQSGRCERGEVVSNNFLHDLGSNLKPSTKTTRDILQTIRVMEQLREIEGLYIKPHYYSLFNELVTNSTKQLSDFLPSNEKTFLLDDEAIEKIINLCALREPKRTGAPINKPPQWRFLSKILDPDERINSAADRERMIHEVMEEKSKPEDVWRTKEAEKQSYTWRGWIDEVTSLFTGVNLNEVYPDDSTSQSVFKRLWEVLDTLEEKTSGGGA
jgi:hypothetical protein